MPMTTGGRDVRADLSARLRADPRVIAALRAKEAQYGRGFGVALSAQELKALGYEVEPDWQLVGNPNPRDGSRDFEKTASLSDPSSASRRILNTAVATGMTYGIGSMVAGPAAAGYTGNAALDTVAIEGAKKVATTAAPKLAGTLLKYGLEYGLPVVGGLLGNKIQANAQRDSDAAMADYYNKALEAEKEERDYRRTFDEDERRYGREFGEEGRRYGRYSDQYGLESDEENLRYGRAGDTYGRESDEEDRAYGRAGDTYGRASDEERLWYDRSQAIRDKNYGYQQYGNFVETLEPFRASGSGAVSRMSGLMGGPTPQDTGSYLNLARTARESVQAVPNVPDRPTWNYSGTRPTFNYSGTRPTFNYTGSGQTEGAAANNPVSTTQPVGGGQTVLIEAPTGEQRDVPIEQAARFIALGARRIS